MKKPITRSVGRLESIRTSDQKLSLPITVSFLGHVIFCVLFILLPKIDFEDKTPTRIVNVQLVPSIVLKEQSAPPAQAAPLPQALPAAKVPESAPEPAPEAAVQTVSKAKDAVSLAPQEIPKKQSMKKKTYKQNLLESAIKSVEKRVETAKTDPKQQALDRIRSELQGKEAPQLEESATTATGATGMIGEGKQISDLQEIYIAEVAYNIQRNWAFSEQLAGEDKNLYNEVVIKIQRSGDIADVWFDRRSGNSYFDESTSKAILKSSPLPPIPDGIPGASLTWGFRFKPGGLN